MVLHHAALADQIRAARDIVVQAPGTLRLQRLAGMLVQILEICDHLLACELDLDRLQSQPDAAAALAGLQAVLQALAVEVGCLVDALLVGRRPPLCTTPGPLKGVWLRLRSRTSKAVSLLRSCSVAWLRGLATSMMKCST